MEVDVGGVRTHVEERGRGEPLVLVHGLGGSTGLWRYLAEPLAEELRVVAYDLRGSGRTQGAATSLAQLVADLDGLMGLLELERALFLGHSLGGSVALAYAAAHPGRTRAVVGLGAPSELPDAGRDGLRARAETVLAEGMGAVAGAVATNGTAPSFRERHPDRFDDFVALIEGNDPAGYAALCRVVADLDIVADLALVAAPVLLLGGELDGVAPPAASEKTAAAIAGARYVQVEDAAHILPFEKPEIVLETVMPFLRDAGA
jgi:pimeloyl-ACP methyl ester carboxylesterase